MLLLQQAIPPTGDQHEEAREVTPLVWQFVVPIPFPLRNVNMYALIAQDGWSLVDAGMDTPQARAAFYAGLDKAGLKVSALQAIVLSHYHPDHIGLTVELQQQSGAQVYMHRLDATALLEMIEHPEEQREMRKEMMIFFARHGVPRADRRDHGDSDAAQHAPLRQRTSFTLNLPPVETIQFIEDGDEIELSHERYQVFWVPGHSDGLVSLLRLRDGLFLSTDHVLPRITPNIGIFAPRGRRPDPLSDYLASLKKVKHVPATLVLPGHRQPFENLAKRVAEIEEHHAHRLQLIVDILAKGPQHAYGVTLQLFAQRLTSEDALRMATAETLAHLEYLRLSNKIRQTTGEDFFLYSL
jgi:glyoxylase-like metal-dependent hydrolase (beta-lactamase superfamily II)